MKRIITCSDGTWNKPGQRDRGVVVETNVQKIFKAIAPKDDKENVQLKFYDQGVGTGVSLVDEIMGGATGAGLDKNICDAYKFILWNFDPGDELYHFGFSRGAFTARSLVGFIRYCGILKPENLHLVNEAYQLYRDQTKLTNPDSDLMVTFRKRYSRETKVKFVGVWDTVGARGIPLKAFKKLNTKRYEFYDTKLSSTVQYAYHALAINEKRKLFEPTLWQKSDTVRIDPKHPQVMEQVWFKGVHSNVGGGYADNGLSDLALDWMMGKAEATGLSIDNSKLPKSHPNPPRYEQRDSFTFMYWFSGSKPREVCNKADNNESVHESVWKLYADSKEKLPKALRKLRPPS